MFKRKNLYKSRDELGRMVEPGLITFDALRAVRDAIRPGVTTLELDALATELIVSRDAEPNFAKVPGYRHTLCISVNDEVVHGIPGSRVLRAGDIVSVDGGAQYRGWNADSAFTAIVPGDEDAVRAERRHALSTATRDALWAGIAALAEARHLNEVGAAIEASVRDSGEYGILEDYIGHGIGRSMHEAPPVFNYAVPDRGPAVKPGLAVAIEPMVTGGGIDTRVGDDEWTVSTTDGSDAAHWEHTVVVHADGIWVTTERDGGLEALAAHGIVPVRP